ncbi:copper resistance D family protein [Paenibacillus tarimensis]
MYVFLESLMYLSFSVLFGAFILEAIPDNRKPVVTVPRIYMTASIIGIIAGSGAQVVKLIIFFMVELGYDLGFVVFRVLRDYDIGHGWLWTLVLGILLYVLLLMKIEPEYAQQVPYIKLAILVLLVGAQGWASHAKAVTGMPGFWSHTFHLLAVTVWIGIVIVIGWFTLRSQNWRQWLGWMTPLSLLCLSITLIAGFMMMFDLAPNYRNSWVLDYGQALLLKHIMIVPLLTVAGLNSVYLRSKLRRVPDYNPLPVLKLESMLVLLIFVTTAYMGHQEPPHDLAETLTESEVHVGPSALFTWFYPGEVFPEMQVQLAVNLTSIVLATVACLSLLLGVWLAGKRKAVGKAFAAFIVCILTGYLAVMTAIS